MEQTFGMNIIRSFFATLDRAVYGFVSSLYELITELANATIIGQGAIEDLYTRIYTLLGIFMLFKITFSFINYIINPDSFTDKAKGVQNLVRNIILVLILIIITPYLFYQLNRIQRAILNDEIIPKFIMGISTDETQGRLKNQFQMSDECGSKFATAASDGDFIALSVLKPFYQLETSTSDIPNGYCATGIVKPSTYLKKDIFNKDRLMEDTYLVDYKFFLSTVVGIVVVLIFVSFCFDIAVRSVKMAFLEMIAPVPIMSFIDPASGKNGLLAKYAKQVFFTWVSLFIRLIALFFAIHIISIIDFAEITQGTKHGILFPLFIILGALIFAKQIPKLIELLIPSLKLGGLQLNPFKKVANDAFGGKQVLGAAAGVAGIGLGAASWAGSKIRNGAEDKVNNLKKQREIAVERWGESDSRVASLDSRITDAQNHLNAVKARRTARMNNIRGTLHIDEIAFSPVTNSMKELARGLTQMKDAAKIAYKQGESQKFSPIGVGKESSKQRDYKDKYSFGNRVADTATDFFGIKNESGTTSKTKEDIKAQEQIIAALQQNLTMMNSSFSDLYSRVGAEEASRMLTRNQTTGMFEFNTSYDVAAAQARGVRGSDIANIKSILSQIADATTAQQAAQKELNRLQRIRDSRPGSSSGSGAAA